MDAKTLEALKASIAKWERNAEAKTPRGYKTGPDDCPLCKLFFFGRGLDSCIGCPVAERTGDDSCCGSPYQVAWETWFDWSNKSQSVERRVRAHAAARDEVAFLKSLLPEETP